MVQPVGSPVRDTLWTIALQLAVAVAVAVVLVIGERYLGWPLAIRQIGSGVLIVIGGLLMSGGSSGVLYKKGAVREVGGRDIDEYKATRAGNLSAGVRLFIIGAVLFASLFVL